MDISSANWSEIAEANNLVPPDGFSTGEDPGDVKLSFREIMGALKRDWDWSRPVQPISLVGSPNLWRIQPTTPIAGYVEGMVYAGVLAGAPSAGGFLTIGAKGYKEFEFALLSGFLRVVTATWGYAGMPAVFYYDPALADGDGAFVLLSQPAYEFVLEEIPCPITADTAAVAAGTAQFTFRLPYGFALAQIKASLKTAQVGGSALTIAARTVSGAFGPVLAFVNAANTADSGAFLNVLAADDAEVTIDVTQIGDGTARGLKVTLLGYQT